MLQKDIQATTNYSAIKMCHNYNNIYAFNNIKQKHKLKVLICQHNLNMLKYQGMHVMFGSC